MTKNILLICLLSIIGLGCSNRNKGVDLKEVDFSFFGTVNVRPIIITSGGKSQWSEKIIEEYTQYVNVAYRPTGLYFNFMRPLYMEHPDWFSPGTIALELGMSNLSMRYSSERGEFVIWFIDSFDNFYKGAAGIANMPQNIVGRLQHGVFIASNIGKVTGMAHEIGHNFGLNHAWEDNLTDTPTRDKKDCVRDPCNFMAYCFSKSRPIGSCTGKSFSPQQVALIQSFARMSPRNEVVITRHKDLNASKVFIQLRSGGPVVCDP